MWSTPLSFLGADVLVLTEVSAVCKFFVAKNFHGNRNTQQGNSRSFDTTIPYDNYSAILLFSILNLKDRYTRIVVDWDNKRE